MATGGTIRATFLGIGPQDKPKNYVKSWVMQEVTGITVAEEIAALIDRGSELQGAYAEVTKGLALGASLTIDIAPSVEAPEANPYANRAAIVSVELTTEPGKRGTLAIQAARDTLFIGNSGASTIVDITDPALVAYHGFVEDYVLISDGEEVGAMLSGYRVDRAFSGND